MENIEEKYSDIQEITFWQQLNKQLIEKRNLGEPVTEENQKTLQKSPLGLLKTYQSAPESLE